MISVMIVTNKNKTVLRRVRMDTRSQRALRQVVTSLNSLIENETDIVHIVVDYGKPTKKVNV